MNDIDYSLFLKKDKQIDTPSPNLRMTVESYKKLIWQIIN